MAQPDTELQKPEMPRARQGIDLTLHVWGQSISSWEAQKRESELWAKDFPKEVLFLPRAAAAFSLWGFLVQIF